MSHKYEEKEEENGARDQITVTGRLKSIFAKFQSFKLKTDTILDRNIRKMFN